MIPYILAAIGGWLIGSSSKNEDSNIANTDDKYTVFLRTDEGGKSSMIFSSFKEANDIFDSVKKSGKIKYQTILENSPSEEKLYKDGLEKGYTKNDGLSSPEDTLSVQEVVFRKGNDVFEEKEF